MTNRSARSLKSFFYPESIAIIGASANLSTISGRPIKYLLKNGYKGRVYPVNPKYDEIAGFKCYPSVRQVPEGVDCAMIIVKAEMVMTVLQQCVEAGVKYAIVVSSGFAEVGEDGREKQRVLSELARDSGIRICGPNCQGMVNVAEGVTACFSSSLEMNRIISGPVGFVSQSGAFGYSTFSLAQEAGVGFKYVVSTGNEADLDACDFMEFMLEDPEIKVVAAYMEGIKDGHKLLQVAEAAKTRGKPVLIMKVGRSEVGKKAVSSHTGALAGSDDIFDSVARQYGLVRIDDIGEFIDLACLFSTDKHPAGGNVAILSTSGGAGVMMADELISVGLGLPELNGETRDKILKVIPSYGSALNPVDMTAEVINNPKVLGGCLNTLSKDDDINIITIIITMVTGELAEKLAVDIRDLAAASEKPVIVVWTAASELVGKAFETLNNAGIPILKTPVRAARAIHKWAGYYVGLRKADRVETDDQSIKEKCIKMIELFNGVYTEDNLKKVLELYSIATVREQLAKTSEESVEYAGRIGYPVVLKIVSEDIAHKTEVGGVMMGLQNAHEVNIAFNSILERVGTRCPDARIRGVLVQEMVENGREVILGSINDAQFGPVVMFGLGGIFVEVLKDVVYRKAPFSYEVAQEMISEIKGLALLKGARGQAPSDTEKLARTLVDFSKLVHHLKNIAKEIEINPLLVLPEGQGVKVVDVLLVPTKFLASSGYSDKKS